MHRNKALWLKCLNCGRECRGENALTEHINEKHVTDARRFCDECNIMFRTRLEFAEHQIRSHTCRGFNERSQINYSRNKRHVQHPVRDHAGEGVGQPVPPAHHHHHEAEWQVVRRRRHYQGRDGRPDPHQSHHQGSRYHDNDAGSYRYHSRYEDQFALTTHNRFDTLPKNARLGRARY